MLYIVVDTRSPVRRHFQSRSDDFVEFLVDILALVKITYPSANGGHSSAQPHRLIKVLSYIKEAARC